MTKKGFLFLIPLTLLSVLALNASMKSPVAIVDEEIKYEKHLDKDVEPFRLNGWLQEHFIYDLGKAGHCENVTACVEELNKKGYTTGVCYDYSRVFSYLYVKAGYGDPLIVTTKVGNERHDQVLFITKDGYIAEAYGMGGDVVSFGFASEILKVDANRQKKDIYLYELVKALGYVTGYPEDIAKARQGYVVKKGENTVHITGGARISCDCPYKTVWGCPMVGWDITVDVNKPVCKIKVDDREIPLIMSFDDYIREG